jgi:hypothetical protein
MEAKDDIGEAVQVSDTTMLSKEQMPVTKIYFISRYMGQ